jgi:hypothetical protein
MLIGLGAGLVPSHGRAFRAANEFINWVNMEAPGDLHKDLKNEACHPAEKPGNTQFFVSMQCSGKF